MENKELFNTATYNEAKEIFDNSNVVVRDSDVVFYVQHEEEVDQKPDQLIGIESEDSVIGELNKMYIPIIAVGPEVKDIKPGDSLYINHKIAMSAEHFTVNELKFQNVSERFIKIFKRA